MKRLFTLWLILFATASTLYAQHGDSVVYEKDNQIITFYADGTYKYVFWPCDICPRLTPGNVQSFGTYEKDSSSYYLFSDKSLRYRHRGQHASESVCDNDSLTFRFHIPHPNNKDRIKEDWIFFQVILYLMPDSAEWEALRNSNVENDPNIKAYYTDDVTLSIPKPTKKLWYYTVKVYSVSDQAEIPQLTLDYNINSPSSNVFDIDLPMATPEFFIYSRFYNKRISVLDKDAVLLGNNVLLRVGAFKDIYYSEYASLPKKYWKYVNGSIDASLKNSRRNVNPYDTLPEWRQYGDVSICGIHFSEESLNNAVLRSYPHNFWNEKQYEDAGFDCDSCRSVFVDTLCQRYLKNPQFDYYIILLDKICQQSDGWIGEYMTGKVGEIFEAAPYYVCYYAYKHQNKEDNHNSQYWKLVDHLSWYLSGSAVKTPSVKVYQNELKARLWKLIPEKEVREFVSKKIIDNIAQ